MITVPWLVMMAVGGAASAAGGWLFHKAFKSDKRLAALEAHTGLSDSSETPPSQA